MLCHVSHDIKRSGHTVKGQNLCEIEIIFVKDCNQVSRRWVRIMKQMRLNNFVTLSLLVLILVTVRALEMGLYIRQRIAL